MAIHSTRKPLIIYVSGAPGSGKTTLADHISAHFSLPRISSDLVHGGIEFTMPGHSREDAIHSVFVSMMVDAAKYGMSFVVDQVLRKGSAEKILAELRPHATVIYLHTHCRNPIDRYTTRIKSSNLLDMKRRKPILIERADFHRENLINTEVMLDLDLPSLAVATDDGYDPVLEDILNFVDGYRS